MTYIRIAIANPFKYSPFKNYWQGEYLITKNKLFEIGFYRYAWDLFEFELDLRFRGHDHAGPHLEMGIFGYTVRIGIADRRHWNCTKNDWERYDQDY
jgi:hypothetical protein